MAQPVESTTTILSAPPFWMLVEMTTLCVKRFKQESSDKQTDKQTDATKHYLPCFAVDKDNTLTDCVKYGTTL